MNTDLVRPASLNPDLKKRELAELPIELFQEFPVSYSGSAVFAAGGHPLTAKQVPADG